MKDNISFNIINDNKNNIKKENKEFSSLTFILIMAFIVLSCVYVTFFY